MVSIAVRPAGPADAPELARLAALALEELGAQRGGAVWARREGAWLHAPLDGATCPSASFVGTLDGVVLAAAVVEVQALGAEGRLAVLRGIYVEPGGRQLGLGEELMAASEYWAREQGCEGIDSFVLPGNRDAKNFFERAGLVARGIVVHHRFEEQDP